MELYMSKEELRQRDKIIKYGSKWMVEDNHDGVNQLTDENGMKIYLTNDNLDKYFVKVED